MADEKNMEAHYAEMDYEAHENTYAGVMRLFKWSIVGIVVAVILVFIAIT